MSDVPMTIEEACMSILGDELATNMIADIGLHWTIPTAMAKARDGETDPRAIAAIDRHIGKTRR